MSSAARLPDIPDDRYTRTMDRLAALADGRRSAMTALLRSVTDLMPRLAAGAHLLDRQSAFPTDEIASLRAAGVLRAPAPVRHG